MGRRDENGRDIILILHRHAGTALTAAALGAVSIKRRTLNIAGSRNRDDHIFDGNEVFIFKVLSTGRKDRAARRCEFLSNLGQFLSDNGLNARTGAKNVQ